MSGSGCAIVCAGDILSTGRTVCGILEKQGVHPTLVNARFVKPLSVEFYSRLFGAHGHVVTMENNSLAAGFGSSLLELAAGAGIPVSPILRLGYPDSFIEHGSNAQILEKIGLDPKSAADRVARFVRSGNPGAQ